ncbi:hypothetical protein AMTR_s00027p00224960 [Amborella trichopoda]|uniref:Uncharacterized protein n=1 Tax=Amborella trichopoda TaxID=13333 RepID=W1PLB5_AMBTC|nr:hypothetical protein AMTR_s00027p00224960 [Amborella trichopoda]
METRLAHQKVISGPSSYARDFMGTPEQQYESQRQATIAELVRWGSSDNAMTSPTTPIVLSPFDEIAPSIPQMRLPLLYCLHQMRLSLPNCQMELPLVHMRGNF